MTQLRPNLRPAPFIVCLLLALSVGSLASARGGHGHSSARESALVSDLPSGQEVGTPITLSVASEYVEEGARYRLSIATFGKDWHVTYDYAPATEFAWTPIDDGPYLLVLSIRSADGTDIDRHHQFFWVRGPAEPVAVRPTTHPLVALYSARGRLDLDRSARRHCGRQGLRCQMRVVFQHEGSEEVSATAPRRMRAWGGMNFLVAGMREESTYRMRHELLDRWGRHVAYGPSVTFETGSIDGFVPDTTVIEPASGAASEQDPVLFSSGWARTVGPYATDLSGAPIWYSDWPGNLIANRLVAGGTILGLGTNEVGLIDEVVETDLLGNVVRMTNLDRVNEQLAAMGEDEVIDFHHETRRLPNGHTAVLGSVLKLLDGVQGPGPAWVLGDNVMVLDENFQLVWVWNGFEHLDPSRESILGSVCTGPPGCPPFLDLPEGQPVNDWTHSNALDFSPVDGSLIISVRNQNWVVKIDYGHGKGDGNVLWRLGAEGDFEIESDARAPWHSHAHDAHWLTGNRLALFDNGNSRCVLTGYCMSRGQVYEIDEEERVVRLPVNFELGRFVFAVGSAQWMRNGGYAFGLGLVVPPSNPSALWSHSAEYTPDGDRTFVLGPHAPSYRTYRLRDLYSPPRSVLEEAQFVAPEPVPAREEAEIIPANHGRARFWHWNRRRR